MSIPDALDLEVHRAQRALDLAKNESRIRPMTNTIPAPFPPDFYTKTLTNIANLRQEYDHNDTLHRFLGDAEAAIANLIVLNDAAIKDRDEARAAIPALEKTIAFLEHDRDETRKAFDVAQGRLSALSDERDAAVQHAGRCSLNQGHIVAGNHARKRLQDELDAAIKSRDIAVASEARLIKERDVANERALDWSTRYEALFEQATHLAREVDRLKSEKADRIKASAEAKPDLFPVGSVVQYAPDGRRARVTGEYTFSDGCKFLTVEIEAHGQKIVYHWRESLCRGVVEPIDPVTFAQKLGRTQRESPIKVGDRVVNVADGNTPATVIGFFTSIEGVRFVAVESTWGRSYFWRLDLCNPARVNT